MANTIIDIQLTAGWRLSASIIESNTQNPRDRRLAFFVAPSSPGISAVEVTEQAGTLLMAMEERRRWVEAKKD